MVEFAVYIHFNPRSPWGERPAGLFSTTGWKTISIHAPRGGSDPSRMGIMPEAYTFQSTLPVGGATDGFLSKRQEFFISIHAPRGGSDCERYSSCVRLSNFNPRSPWGERLGEPELVDIHSDFNPRSPWGERQLYQVNAESFFIFQSTLPVGGATFFVPNRLVWKH